MTPQEKEAEYRATLNALLTHYRHMVALARKGMQAGTVDPGDVGATLRDLVAEIESQLVPLRSHSKGPERAQRFAREIEEGDALQKEILAILAEIGTGQLQ